MYAAQIVFLTCVIAETAGVMFFITACADIKIKNKYIAVVLGSLLYVLLTYTFREIYQLYIAGLYLMILLYCRFMLDGNIVRHISIAVGVLASNIFSRAATLVYACALFGLSDDSLVLTAVSSVICFFVWKTLNLLFLWGMYVIVKRTYKRKVKETIFEGVLLCFNIMIAVIFTLWFRKNGISNDNIVYVNTVLLSVFVVSFIYVCVLHYINYNNKTEARHYRLEKYIQEQQKNLIRIEEDYYNARKLRHDINKMFRIYLRLLKENRVREVMDAIEQQMEDIPSGFWVYVKDNNSINGVINEKKDICMKRDIDLCVQITAQIESKMEMDVAVLIYNLLDNAIETQTGRTENAKININIFECGGMYNIVVKNTISGSVLKKNPGLNTTKEDIFYHGIGLKSIRDTIDKYGGMIDFDECEDIFIVHVAIPL